MIFYGLIPIFIIINVNLLILLSLIRFLKKKKRKYYHNILKKQEEIKLNNYMDSNRCYDCLEIVNEDFFFTIYDYGNNKFCYYCYRKRINGYITTSMNDK